MKPQTEIADFRKVLELAVADGKSIMVGGHAVNFWALFYFPRIKVELRQFLPFTSKDLDFYGDIHLLDRLVKKFGGVKRMSQPRGPVIGQVELEIDGIKRIVEVLHSVHGLSSKDLSSASSPVLEVDQCQARVLDPISLLKAKIHNAADFKQDERNDVRHVKIMIFCVRESFWMRWKKPSVADSRNATWSIFWKACGKSPQMQKPNARPCYGILISTKYGPCDHSRSPV